MSIEELNKQTTVNIQEKANLIWAIADKLVGTYKPHEYGNVIDVIEKFDTPGDRQMDLETDKKTRSHTNGPGNRQKDPEICLSMGLKTLL